MAKIMGIVANEGTLDGKILMKPQFANVLFDPIVTSTDKVINMKSTYGLGTQLIESPQVKWTIYIYILISSVCT